MCPPSAHVPPSQHTLLRIGGNVLASVPYHLCKYSRFASLVNVRGCAALPVPVSCVAAWRSCFARSFLAMDSSCTSCCFAGAAGPPLACATLASRTSCPTCDMSSRGLLSAARKCFTPLIWRAPMTTPQLGLPELSSVGLVDCCATATSTLFDRALRAALLTFCGTSVRDVVVALAPGDPYNSFLDVFSSMSYSTAEWSHDCFWRRPSMHQS